MEEITLSITKEDGEIFDSDETVQDETPSEHPENESEGAHKETSKETEERNSTKRHKSSRPPHSEHPCSRGAFHDLYVDLRNKERLADMPRYFS